MAPIPFLDIDVWHAFFYFLGTPEGEFAKKTFELLIFGLLTYMLWHEYWKSKRNDLKLLMIGFGALALEKFFSVSLYANRIFGAVTIGIGPSVIPVIDNTLEIFALILVTNALIYPLYRKRIKALKETVRKEIIILATTTILLEVSWVLYFEDYQASFQQFTGLLFFTLFKIGILGIAMHQITRHKTIRFKYREWVFLALLVYTVTPVLNLINFIFFENNSARLEVMAVPFPFIAALIIFHLVYLKLVDKAVLMRRVQVSEQKYLQEKEVSMLKDKFLSVVSHELRTPLTSIKLYLGLLLKGNFGKVKPKQREAVEVVKKESDRLSDLISDVLDLSKLERGETLKTTSFPLRELVGPLCHNQANERGITLMNAIPQGMKVKADQSKIKQVIINLVGNALKFTNSGGKVTVSAAEDYAQWSLRVQDTGVGIPKEELPKIFDKFYQIEHHMIRTKGGSGLGLTIVKEIVELHGGKIRVDSEIGKGTTFIITIPKREKEVVE